MTDHVADRKRPHSAVDLSVEDKRQRLQEEIAMIAAECQEEAPIEWDEDEERVWKQRRKHIDDLISNQTYERVPRQSVSQRVLSYRWVDKPLRSRYTVRGFELELTGAEDYYAPTPFAMLGEDPPCLCGTRRAHGVFWGLHGCVFAK